MLKRHPFRSLGLVLITAVVFFFLSASGQADSFWKNGPSWLGAIGWFGFLLCLLAFLVLGGYTVASKILARRRSRAAA